MRIAFRERLIRTPCTRLLAGRRAINDAAVSQPAAAAAAMQWVPAHRPGHDRPQSAWPSNQQRCEVERTVAGSANLLGCCWLLAAKTRDCCLILGTTVGMSSEMTRWLVIGRLLGSFSCDDGGVLSTESGNRTPTKRAGSSHECPMPRCFPSRCRSIACVWLYTPLSLSLSLCHSRSHPP